MKALTDTICLWRHSLSLGVIDVINSQVELIIMLINTATILRSPVGQNTQHGQVVRLEEGQDFVIEHIRCGNGRLGRVELAEGHFAAGIDKCLLIKPTNTFQVAYIERAL